MSLTDDMAVEVPEGTRGSVTVERFTVEAQSLENMRLAFDGRGCRPGTYTRLLRNGHLWMSDTTAERRDHIGPALAIRAGGVESVLIGGLGLGMILRVALTTPGVRTVDVVEIDQDVVDLVGPHYEKMAADVGVDLRLHRDDLFTHRWPTGSRWDVAWFDVWENLCVDNLDSMARLGRSYGRRCGWWGCWGRDLLRAERRRLQASGWW